MHHTRELHIISGELSILKRTLYPIYNMVNALRDHHIAQKKIYFRQTTGAGISRNATFPEPTPNELDPKLPGDMISDVAKVYLTDVGDHVLILTEDVDILRGTVENMINMVLHSLRSLM